MKNKRKLTAWEVIYGIFFVAMASLILAMAYQEYVYYINRGF